MTFTNAKLEPANSDTASRKIKIITSSVAMREKIARRLNNLLDGSTLSYACGMRYQSFGTSL